MKGINPFTPGIQKPDELIGRKIEAGLFDSYLSSTIAGQPVFMQIIGPKGIGKTSLLRYFQIVGEKNRALVVLFKAQKKENVKRLLEELENALAERVATGEMQKKHPDAVQEMLKKNKGHSDAGLQLESAHKILRKNVSAMVFIIDDINQLKNSELKEITGMFSKIAEKKLPFMLVLATAGHRNVEKELFRPVYVSPLKEKDMREFLEKTLGVHGMKMGDECLRGIEEDSQGHPLVLLTICWTIYDKIKENEKVISKGHYVSYLPTIMGNLARELFDDLYNENSESEKNILKTIAKLGGEATVSKIADSMGKPLNTITTLALRLAESGNIKKTERGRYQIFNRLYGKYVLGK